MAFAGASLAMARSNDARRRFGFCFAIASVGWLLGLILATGGPVRHVAVTTDPMTDTWEAFDARQKEIIDLRPR